MVIEFAPNISHKALENNKMSVKPVYIFPDYNNKQSCQDNNVIFWAEH